MKNIAIVTGASSGIGREFIKQIYKLGIDYDEIWIIARRKERLENIKKKLGNMAFKIFVLDLSHEESLLKYKKMLELEKPNVKLLINNAGFGKLGQFSDLDIQQQMQMIDVNIKALTYITYETLKFMKAGGRIVQIASAAAFLPQPYFTVYAATKSYVLSFSRALRKELSEREISVTAVCPGPIDTEFFYTASNSGMPKLYKRLLLVPVHKVVKQAMMDSLNRKELSIYGIIIKLFRLLSKILPHRFMMKFIKD